MAEEKKKKTPQQDDDVVGKVYDGRIMRRLVAYLRPYKWQAVVSLLAVFLKAFFDVIGPFLVKVAVDLYMTAKPEHHLNWFTRHLSPKPATGITQLASIYLAALTLSYGLEWVQTYMMQWTGQKVMFDMRSQIFRHIQRMHVSFFDHNPVGRLVTRLTGDVDALNEMFTSGVFSIFEDAFVLIGIVIIMLSMSWWLALIAFSVLPFILLVTRMFRKHVRESYRRVRGAIARINSYTQEHVSGMSVVQLFNREERSYQAFEKVNNQHMIAFKDTILAYALYYPAVELLSSIAIALVIWLGGNGVMRNAVQLGVLIAFIQYAQRFFRPIQDMSEKYNILQAAMAASERIFKLLDEEPTVVAPSAPRPAPQRIAAIEFENVWFAYQGEDWVLRDVSFIINPGETIAVVGHT